MERVVGIQAQIDVKETELDKLYNLRDTAVDTLGNISPAARATSKENMPLACSGRRVKRFMWGG